MAVISVTAQPRALNEVQSCPWCNAPVTINFPMQSGIWLKHGGRRTDQSLRAEMPNLRRNLSNDLVGARLCVAHDVKDWFWQWKNNIWGVYGRDIRDWWSIFAWIQMASILILRIFHPLLYHANLDLSSLCSFWPFADQTRWVWKSLYTTVFENKRVVIGISILYSPPEGYLPSCSYYKTENQRLPSGHYMIDPDVHGPQKAFRVYCDMRDKKGVGVTLVGHDSESDVSVNGCEPKGCFSHSVTYPGVSQAQLAKLTDLSLHCEQFIKYKCRNTAVGLKAGNSWLESRSGVKMTYWGGATPGSNKCACGMTKSCVAKKVVCNCDMNDNAAREDSGLLTHKPDLPVSKLRFGDLGSSGENGLASLGKLKCYGFEACRKNACLNGGICKALVHGGLTCVCQAGFSGKECKQGVLSFFVIAGATFVCMPGFKWCARDVRDQFQIPLQPRQKYYITLQ